MNWHYLKKNIRHSAEAALFLLLAFAISQWAIKKYKKPEQMSLLQALAMDMSGMKAPEGEVPVAIEKVKLEKFEEQVTYTGTVLPYNEADIFPRTTGWVENLYVYSGDRVRKGEVIAQLDTRELSSRLLEAENQEKAAKWESAISQYELEESKRNIEIAKAKVEEAQAEDAQAQAELEYWKKEFQREETLFQNGAISKQEYDMAKASLDKAKGMIAQTKAKIAMAQKELQAAQIAQKRLHHHAAHAEAMWKEKKAMKNTAAILKSYATIQAPFEGYVTKRWVSPGTLVQPGLPLVRLAQIDPVRVQANVAVQDLEGIEKGDPVTIKAEKSSKIIKASITALFPAADPSSRTATVEAIVPNPSFILLPGDFVSVTITKQSKRTLSVPVQALFQKEGKWALFTVQEKGKGRLIYQCPMHPKVQSDKPGIDPDPHCRMKLVPKKIGGGKRAHLVFVKKGMENSRRVEILSGLKEGDAVIFQGQEDLKENDRVLPVEWRKEGPKTMRKLSGNQSMKEIHHGN